MVADENSATGFKTMTTTLILVGILTLISVAVELYIVFCVPFVHQILGKWIWLAVAFSVALSCFLGALFAAHGLIALIAGLLSMCITVPVYKTHSWFTNVFLPWLEKLRGKGREKLPVLVTA